MSRAWNSDSRYVGSLHLLLPSTFPMQYANLFRPQEVRSVGHSLFEGDTRYIPDKPVTVNTNFRSHAGILSTAAAVLDRMFEVFPRSANKLEPDVGVFLGPRPGIFQNLSLESLTELVSRIDGVVLLTHDHHVGYIQGVVGESVIVLGIRESKGLEFPNCIIGTTTVSTIFLAVITLCSSLYISRTCFHTHDQPQWTFLSYWRMSTRSPGGSF